MFAPDRQLPHGAGKLLAGGHRPGPGRADHPQETDLALLHPAVEVEFDLPATGQAFRRLLTRVGCRPDPATLVAEKPKNILISDRADWFWKSSPDLIPSLRYARGGLRDLVTRLGPYWMNNPKKLSKGIKGCVNTYPLERSV